MAVSPEEFEALKQRLDALERRLAEPKVEPRGGEEPPVKIEGEREPPPDVAARYAELGREMGDAKEAIISVIVGCYRYGGADRQFCWYSKSSKIPLEVPVVDCSDEAATGFASIFSSTQRLRLLEAMVGAAQSATQLRAKTGLGSGVLYHHLRELMHAGFVEQRGRGRYALTGEGMKGLITFLHVAADRSRAAAQRRREAEPGTE